MNYTTWVRKTAVLCIFAMLVLLPAAALAQDGAPEDAEDFVPEVTVEGDPAMYPDPEPDAEGDLQAAEADLVLAQPPYTMNYQGYLTDSGGVPVDGSFDFVARLYDAEVAGTAEWGPETHNDVPVVAGLFNLVLGSTVQLLPNDFDEALFLELSVNGTTLPRQPLRTTAYAFALVPGAEVQGTPVGSTYALSVINEAAAATSRGLYVTGRQYGLYADESGTGDVAIYTPKYVRALGYRSSADSHIFIPGHLLIPPDSFDSNQVSLDPEIGGRTNVRAKIAGTRTVYLPIQVPSVLFGQDVTVEQVQLHYELTDPTNTFITSVALERRNLADGAIVTMYSSPTDLKGSGMRSVIFTPVAANATLSSTTGPISLRLALQFQDLVDSVRIYGVRVRLGHQ